MEEGGKRRYFTVKFLIEEIHNGFDANKLWKFSQYLISQKEYFLAYPEQKYYTSIFKDNLFSHIIHLDLKKITGVKVQD